jgi:hypothetical protein
MTKHLTTRPVRKPYLNNPWLTSGAIQGFSAFAKRCLLETKEVSIKAQKKDSVVAVPSQSILSAHR